MRLIANRAFTYRGHALKVGEVFEAKTSDARAWKATRFASDAPPEKPASKKSEPAPEKVDSEPHAAPEKPAPDRGSQYRNRRLRTDD
jgi:hypothetical protein